MIDFLKFNTFITTYVLISFYYIGALLVPFLIVKYKNKISNILSKTNWIYLLVVILFLELGWRMFFEMLVAYFDMHTYLYEITQTIGNKI